MALIRPYNELGTGHASHLVEARVLASVHLKEQGFDICKSLVI